MLSHILGRNHCKTLLSQGLNILTKTHPSLQCDTKCYINTNQLCINNNKSYTLPPPTQSIMKAILDKPQLIDIIRSDIPLLPFGIEKIDIVDINKVDMEEPILNNQIIEKHAIVMINKRRIKMNKHKRKKLYVRMKFAWAKIRQKRKSVKEKAFQLEMSTLVKKGEKFNAEEYVNEKLNLLHAELLPAHYQNRNMPEYVIRELIDKRVRKKSEKEAKAARLASLPSLFTKDWNV